MRKHKVVIGILIALILIYALLALAIPPESAVLTKYHITADSVRLLSFTFIIPLAAVWSMAVYAYIRFNTYAMSIKDTKDGKALSNLSHGLLALALWVPVNTVLQNIASYLWHREPGAKEVIIIISNYLTVILLLVVAYLIWRGSRELLSVLKLSAQKVTRRYLYLATLIAAVLLGWLVLATPAQASPVTSGAITNYLSKWLIVFTVVIPYSIVWYFGLEAMQNLHVYRNRVNGVIYRTALSYIAYGIAFSITSVLCMRILTLMTSWVGSLTLKFILMLIYALIFVIGLGYWLVWVGTKKLALIEEV